MSRLKQIDVTIKVFYLESEEPKIITSASEALNTKASFRTAIAAHISNCINSERLDGVGLYARNFSAGNPTLAPTKLNSLISYIEDHIRRGPAKLKLVASQGHQ